jgi:hypothetical protein
MSKNKSVKGKKLHVVGQQQAAASAQFKEGDAVEFDSPKRGVVKGVVVSFPKTRGARITVSTAHGQMAVPPTMLRPAKVAKVEQAKLAERGQAFESERSANFERRQGTLAKLNQERLERLQLKRYQTVKYNHQEVLVVAVHMTEGKVTITNPKVDLVARMRALGVSDIPEHLLHLRSTLKVWATRVRPV